jgi:hypothetical protein
VSFPNPCTFSFSTEDMDDNEVEDGDCLGVSFGEAAAVEGEDSAVELTFRRRAARVVGTAVEAIMNMYFPILSFADEF